MKKRSITRTVIALAPLVMALPFAMDLYVPAIPRMTGDFHVSDATMQLTLNLFMLMSAMTQCFIGPLADWKGRRPITAGSILIFALGLAVCAHAHSLLVLLVGRLIEAIGSCGMMVLGFAIARDLYTDRKLARIYSILNGIIAFSPMFAPFIGSALDMRFGWPSTFESLYVVVLAALLLYFNLLPETLTQKQRIPVTTQLITTYATMLKNRYFNTYTLFGAIGLSYLFLFCALSPVLLIQTLHVPEAHYGYYFCFMGVSLLIGSSISAAIVTRIGIDTTIRYGFIITALGGLLMLGWYAISGVSVLNFVVPMLLIGIGGTFSMGASSAGAVIPFPKHAGAANALSGGLRFFFVAIAGLLASHFAHTTLALSLPAISMSVLGLLMQRAIFKK